MESIRKWFYRPKKDDTSLLAQFFYADEALNIIANELDSFDGRKDPERCTTLVNQLRQSQDKVLTITNSIMDVLIGDERANRDFRVKFPEDVLQENLAGQLWFGAECLAAGSSIMNREQESTMMRPLAKAVTKSLEHVRNLLRQACLRNNTPNGPLKLDDNELITEMLVESLKIFDKFFAEFELAYVSAMVPVKSTQEYELQEMIGVLFSETLQRALKTKLLAQETVDSCDPALMFTIPRLAIVQGLLTPSGEPLHIDGPPEGMSDMFRPFRTLLLRIRELLWTLNKRELYLLQRLLCDNVDVSDIRSLGDMSFEEETCLLIDPKYTDCSKRLLYPNVDRPDSDVKENHNSIDTPSTSSMNLLSNAITSDSGPLEFRNTSPPDSESLQVISVAAATLSSILTNEKGAATDKDASKELESPNDSGISTETTSLDRSPTFDGEENRCRCIAICKCRINSEKTNRHKKLSHPPGTSKLNNRRRLNARRRSLVKYTDSVLDGIESSSEDSSDTYSFNSVFADHDEVSIPIHTADIATRSDIKAKYRSSEDLLHRLFVCVAGVADQLQTNFASDLRNILKAVFLMNTSDSSESQELQLPTCLDTSTSSIEYHPPDSDVTTNEFTVDPNILAQEALFDTNVYFQLGGGNSDIDVNYTNHPRRQEEEDADEVTSLSENLYRISLRHDYDIHSTRMEPARPIRTNSETPPVWIPDVEAPKCMNCGVNFTVVKRRHHCRNCGKIFCARCSSNNVPLPKFGHNKPVRVCNKCFLYNLPPFTMCE